MDGGCGTVVVVMFVIEVGVVGVEGWVGLRVLVFVVVEDHDDLLGYVERGE